MKVDGKMTLETLSMQIARSRLFFIISFASNFLFVTPAAVIRGGAAIYNERNKMSLHFVSSCEICYCRGLYVTSTQEGQKMIHMDWAKKQKK